MNESLYEWYFQVLVCMSMSILKQVLTAVGYR